MLGMRVKREAKKILFAVILGLPLMMAIVMPPAYAAIPDAFCIFRNTSASTGTTFCTTDLSSDSITHVQIVKPLTGPNNSGVIICHFDKTSATSTTFFGTFAHTDNISCPSVEGSPGGFSYVVV